jgi:hypothetical protein
MKRRCKANDIIVTKWPNEESEKRFFRVVTTDKPWKSTFPTIELEVLSGPMRGESVWVYEKTFEGEFINEEEDNE